MNCTDIQNQAAILGLMEKSELRAALRAHGGEYNFGKTGPFIEASTYSCAEFGTFRLTKAVLTEHSVSLYGIGENSECSELLFQSPLGQLQVITRAIPATENISDVTGL